MREPAEIPTEILDLIESPARTSASGATGRLPEEIEQHLERYWRVRGLDAGLTASGAKVLKRPLSSGPLLPGASAFEHAPLQWRRPLM